MYLYINVYIGCDFYDCLECHDGGRFEDKMFNPRPDRNRKNNCVRQQL